MLPTPGSCVVSEQATILVSPPHLANKFKHLGRVLDRQAGRLAIWTRLCDWQILPDRRAPANRDSLASGWLAVVLAAQVQTRTPDDCGRSSTSDSAHGFGESDL